MERSFVVESCWPDVHPGQVEQRATRAREVAEQLSGEGVHVEFTGSIFVPGDEVVYLFDGVSEDAVREACTWAAIPFERVVESIRSA